MRFKNYVVVITGAASGIGLETAKKFIHEGANIIGVDLDRNKLLETGCNLGNAFVPFICDITQSDRIIQLSEFIRNRNGRIDVLVNNAGVGKFGITPKEMKESDYYYHFEVLVKAPMLLTRYLHPFMESSKSPSIINIASVAARITVSGHFIYSSAKAALEKFTANLVRDFPNIRSNCILPGWIKTPIYEKETGLSPEEINSVMESVSKRIPCQRIGIPEDIANCILFLASKEASYINGANIVIDGGYSLNPDWGV